MLCVGDVQFDCHPVVRCTSVTTGHAKSLSRAVYVAVSNETVALLVNGTFAWTPGIAHELPRIRQAETKCTHVHFARGVRYGLLRLYILGKADCVSLELLALWWILRLQFFVNCGHINHVDELGNETFKGAQCDESS